MYNIFFVVLINLFCSKVNYANFIMNQFSVFCFVFIFVLIFFHPCYNIASFVFAYYSFHITFNMKN